MLPKNSCLLKETFNDCVKLTDKEGNKFSVNASGEFSVTKEGNSSLGGKF